MHWDELSPTLAPSIGPRQSSCSFLQWVEEGVEYGGMGLLEGEGTSRGSCSALFDPVKVHLDLAEP